MPISDSLGQKNNYGCLHLYTGEGKGKTTAAIGLALRAWGQGGRVMFVQFMKGGQTGELASLKQLGIPILRSPVDYPFYKDMTDAQKQELSTTHNTMLCKVIEAMDKDAVDCVILDEVTYPYNWELLDRELLQSVLQQAKGRVELVCTGRDGAALFWELSDYVTEMKLHKHPYSQGVVARRGVEY